LVECTMKDIFNVGCIMWIAGLISNVIKGIAPPIMRALEIETQTAGILIVIYTLIKFYKDGRKR
jgi:predicted MFS family arabinose efflux permease